MGWSWNDVSVDAGAPSANLVDTPMVSAYLFAAQRTQHVIHTSGPGIINELWSDGSGWHYHDLSAATNAPMGFVGEAYSFEAQRTQHMDYVALDDYHVHELWWDSTGWHLNDLTDATATPSGLTETGGGSPWPAGYVFAHQETQHVNYRRDDGHVIELWWDNIGWHFNDLTLAAYATDVATSFPSGYAFEAQATQHVTYRRDDGHIIELWWDSGVWNHNDLTVATGAPVAYAQYVWYRSGYVFDAQGTQHVIFLGEDFHIHELWWDSNGWHHHDLTNASGAPIGYSFTVPIGYVFAAQGTQHVNYQGADSHIHELWWDSSGWHHNDLTVASGAPATTTEVCVPVGYGFDAQGTQHVFYRDENSHVTQLTWNP